MLSEPLQLNKIEATHLFDFLYSFFHRDFVANRTYLNQTIYIDPRSNRLDDGKEADFWHLTTRKQEKIIKQGNRYIKTIERYPDFRRAERIEWVKQILDNYNHETVKWFYYQETNQKRDIRLYLWAYQDDFVVILQKLGRSSSFLVTSFYIDNEDKKRDYEQRFNSYKNKENRSLLGCEWF